MRKVLKKIVSFVLVPITRWYLRKRRQYHHKGTTIVVDKGVFHPGLFHSTKFLLSYLEQQQLNGKTLLELGCGSGLLSVIAAKRGAHVTASDISSYAVVNTQHNALLNNVDIDVLRSDLFDAIQKKFDFVVINPPYYKGVPKNEVDLAWYCGENFEYFSKLFLQLKNHIQPDSDVIMVLTKGCDVNTIFELGAKHQFAFELIEERNVLFDHKDYLFRIIFNSFAEVQV